MGIDYNKRPQQAAPPPPPPAPPAPPVAPPVPPPVAQQVSLSKVTLTKAAPAISMSKGGGASGLMRVNLNWTQPQRKRGLFRGRDSGAKGNSGRATGSIDLDLAALYELADGTKHGVSALGKRFGSLHEPPYIQLDGDDRSGLNTGGENLTINLDHLDQIRRILIYTFIYEGTPNWADANAVVTLYPVGAAPIEIRLDETGGNLRSCGIALLVNEGGNLTVRREVVYQPAADHLDRHFGWGMNWSAARKD
jgi:tellurite resistance protein TerA